LRTLDGGNSWTVIQFSRAEDIIRAKDGSEYVKYAVQFLDRNRGWRLSRVDSSAVEYTEDGGCSWGAPITVGTFGRALIFVTPEQGWVLGKASSVTRNSGRTWQNETALDGLNLTYPYFLDKDHGWFASESGVIARTTDGGQHWTIIHSSLKNVRTIFFISAVKGWVVGDDGLIATTTNGGDDWTRVSTPVPYDSQRRMRTTLLDVFFQAADIGWIAGYDGVVFSTTNGGQTWTRIPSPTHAPLSSIRFADESRGWAVGGYAEPAMPIGQPSNVVIETTDGGKTWRIKTFS
jgi:photosystem II stability/assembly factor-like uncharacterized protein